MISEILSKGADNALTGREICAVLNITPRDVTAAVERERREGSPICANTGKPRGYYLAADQEEMERYCRGLWKRAGEIFKTRRACINAMSLLPPADPREHSERINTQGKDK